MEIGHNSIGFGDAFGSNSGSNEATSKKKNSKKGSKKGGGGFQVMGLSFPILKAIQKRGYKIPTPIQRKTIPIALQGRDLVAMARTGSGKTACFLIPIFERLRTRCAKTGARALIMSPTRELALQTLRFVRELGRYTDLKAAVVLGGDSMDSQFEALHGNPDIIVATPGRFVHVCVEMELKMSSVEIVVFDEADRLFEMGFGEQLRDIIARLPATRQTLLFSATLPKVLVEFTRAGLTDPTLLRLDVESKLPEELTLGFIWSRPEEKDAALLCLLRRLLIADQKRSGQQQTVLFAATRHHVEYLHMLLGEAGFSSTFLYSCLDPSARKINAAKFREGVVNILVVTDVAARGIDIPDVGIVINYHFPAVPKLFVHRVGRCARAGRTGEAYSLVSREELPYMVDLHLFLGRPLQLAAQEGQLDGRVGCVPAELLEEQHSEVLAWHNDKADFENMQRVCCNAYSKYLKSRPGASVDSVRRSRQLDLAMVTPHPVFGISGAEAASTVDILQRMKHFKPSGTVFELCPKANSEELRVMKQKRSFHEKAIESFYRKVKEQAETVHDGSVKSKLAPSKPEDLENIFSSVLVPRKRKFDRDFSKSQKKKSKVDTENFVPYVAMDQHTEAGLAVHSFEQQAGQAGLDLIGDDERGIHTQQRAKKWDERRKKMVGPKEQVKKIRTESGVWIPATYKSGRYAQWKDKSKADEAASDSGDSDQESQPSAMQPPHRGRGGRRGFEGRGSVQGPGRGGGSTMRGGVRGRGGGGSSRGGRGGPRPELRRPEQILKAREKKERMLLKKKKGKKGGKGRGGGGRGRRK